MLLEVFFQAFRFIILSNCWLANTFVYEVQNTSCAPRLAPSTSYLLDQPKYSIHYITLFCLVLCLHVDYWRRNDVIQPQTYKQICDWTLENPKISSFTRAADLELLIENGTKVHRPNEVLLGNSTYSYHVINRRAGCFRFGELHCLSKTQSDYKFGHYSVRPTQKY